MTSNQLNCVPVPSSKPVGGLVVGRLIKMLSDQAYGNRLFPDRNRNFTVPSWKYDKNKDQAESKAVAMHVKFGERFNQEVFV